MRFLLNLKSWQLFLIFLLSSIFSMFPYIGWIVNLTFLLIYIGWVYSIGSAMHNVIPKHLRPNISYFNFCCLILVFAVLLLSVYVDYIGQDYTDDQFWWIEASIVCLMGIGFYIFSFAAKMLESAIEGRIVGFSDSIKAFFCFWFFPWGLWHIQPAVQRVLAKYESKTNVSPDL
jgi:hypothetical protein